MATSTPRLQLRKPEDPDDVDVSLDIGDNMDKIDDLAVDFYDRGGWQFIASGNETAPWTIDLTAANKFPAGYFNMIRIFIHPRLDTGNSFLIFRVNGLSGATDYNRGWHGASFDGTTVTRNASSSSDRGVAGYISAQQGSTIEVVIYQTEVASDLPIRCIATRGAPNTFDANREWMITTNSLNTDTLIDNINFFVTGVETIAAAVWVAEGFHVP